MGASKEKPFFSAKKKNKKGEVENLLKQSKHEFAIWYKISTATAAQIANSLKTSSWHKKFVWIHFLCASSGRCRESQRKRQKEGKKERGLFK